MLEAGSATKAWAGASILNSRSAPSSLYNPANLTLTRKRELYGELSYLDFTYSYKFGPTDKYPDQKAELRIQTPLPMYGYAWRYSKKLSFGSMLSLIPGEATKAEANGVIIRDAGPPGFIANIKTEGKGLGYDVSFGMGYVQRKNFKLGMSLLMNQSATTVAVEDDETKTILAEGTITNDSKAILLGVRSRISKVTVAGTLIPYRIFKSKKKFTSIDPSGRFPLPASDSHQGPLSIGGAIAYHKAKTLIKFEGKYTIWSQLSKLEGKEALYLDTLDIKAGLGFLLKKKQTINIAYGFYPSNLDDGYLAEETSDGVEIRGYKFGDFESLAVDVISLGYELKKKLSVVQLYFLHQSGQRAVDEVSPAFGNHSLALFHTGGSFTYRF